MGAMPSFRLFGIPVTIRPSFLLIAALIGLSGGSLGLVVAWVVVVFVSILIHELGHALTARSYGAEVAIELNGIGGLTSWSVPGKELGPGRRALVAAAGSGVGVLFGGMVFLFDRFTGPYDGITGFVIYYLIRVNVLWGLLNWLPIRPLDGGHLFTSLLQKVVPSKASSHRKRGLLHHRRRSAGVRAVASADLSRPARWMAPHGGVDPGPSETPTRLHPADELRPAAGRVRGRAWARADHQRRDRS